jgi:hypothetical protein
MLMMKCSSHVQTSRNIKSFHSCRTSTGLPAGHIDLRRICQESAALAGRVIRLSWLARLWGEHMERCRLGRRAL